MNDNSPKKDKVKAGVISLLVHVALVLLLAILTLSVAHPDKDKEDGVPVLLGNVEDAGGEDLGGLPADASDTPDAVDQPDASETPEEADPVPVAPPPAPAKPTPAPKPQPAAKPLITQDQEKSIAAEEAKKKAAEEAKKKAAEEARIKAEARRKLKRKRSARRQKKLPRSVRQKKLPRSVRQKKLLARKPQKRLPRNVQLKKPNARQKQKQSAKLRKRLDARPKLTVRLLQLPTVVWQAHLVVATREIAATPQVMVHRARPMAIATRVLRQVLVA